MRFVSVGGAPTANFTADPVSGWAPLTVQFTDATIGVVDSWEWDFNNDGTVDSNEKNPSYTYENAGSYTVTLKVSGPEGEDEKIKADFITITEAPAQDVIIDNRDLETSFTGTWGVSGASDPYGADSVWSRDGTTFTWHFVPAQTSDYELLMWWTEWTSRSATVPVDIEHEGGTSQVIIDQRTNGGQWNSLGVYPFVLGNTYNITITSQPGPSSTCADAVRLISVDGSVRANFTADPLSGTAPLTVNFNDKSSGDITEWAWDFNNDGTVDSTDQNPSYTYSTAGSYTIKLTVTGPGGSHEETKADYINVSEPALPPVAEFTADPVRAME